MPDTLSKLKIPEDIRVETNRTSSVRLTVSPEIDREITTWLGTEISAMQSRRAGMQSRIDHWRKTLSGVNPEPAPKAGLSHVSVPLTMWARTAIHARITRGIFGQRPFVKVSPSGIKRDVSSDQMTQAARALSKFASVAIKNPRELNGESAVTKATAELVDLGIGAWAVVAAPDIVRKFEPERELEGEEAPSNGKIRGRLVIDKGTTRWEPIPFANMLYFDGYGTDVNKMPFVGYIVPKPWASIQQWAKLGYYDPKAVADVEAFFDTRQGGYPITHREHNVSAIFMDYDIDGDGVLESIMLDYHNDAQKVLRYAWNQHGGFRPIVACQFDIPPNPFDFQGQGVSEKLESPQAEANAIHNIGIEAGKRGVAHLIVVTPGSELNDEIGGDEVILPGTVATADKPREDVTFVPLGDPRAAESAIALEEHNVRYVSRLLGMGDAQVSGDISAGKRTPASLGLAIDRNSKVVVERALDNVSQAMIEALYLTFESWRRRLPINALASVLEDEDIRLLETLVFSTGSSLDRPSTTRDRFIVTVQAQDIASAQEQRKQELMVMNQFMLPYYDKAIELVMLVANPQLPQVLRDILLGILEKSQNGVEALIKNIEGIDDPEEVLIDVANIRTQLSQLNAAPPQVPGVVPPQGGGAVATLPPGDDDETGLGAGTV